MTEVLVVFVLFGALGAALLFMNSLLGPRRHSPVKDTPFECGSPPLEREIKPFPVKYYLVAFLFLVFDIEIVFFFPWAVVFRELGPAGLAVMGAFVFVLAVGFAYAWKKGAFQWDS